MHPYASAAMFVSSYRTSTEIKFTDNKTILCMGCVEHSLHEHLLLLFQISMLSRSLANSLTFQQFLDLLVWMRKLVQLQVRADRELLWLVGVSLPNTHICYNLVVKCSSQNYLLLRFPHNTCHAFV